MRILLFVVLSGTLPLAISGNSAAEHPGVQFERIKIAGANHPNGIFDVAVEYGDNSVGWLTYSEVELPKYVDTHVARSTDRGKTWMYASAVNKSVDGVMLHGGKRIQGVWRYETPTLVYDATDRPSRRWKLFVQKYFVEPPYKKEDRFFGHGYIEYRFAAQPDGDWSAPVCLFGKHESGCRVDLNELHPSLNKMVFYNEIGSINVNGTLYLSLDASPTRSGLGKWEQRKIILVASSDHGETWRYVGTLTDHDDAEQFGYRVFTGSSLVKEQGQFYLLVTPSGREGIFVGNRGHDGTMVFAFEDISRARLRRDAESNLVVLRHIKPKLHSGGLSDYDEKNSYGGILFSQINTKSPPKFFQVFSTRLRISR